MDKYVGESAKNIERVFEEAKAQDAVLVFDEAEGLFAERSNEVRRFTLVEPHLIG